MRTLTRVVTVASLLAIIFAIPIAAQLTNSVIFDTSFPFYAGNAEMPAGTYRISQSDPGTQLLLLENTSGSQSIFLEYTPTSSETPHPQTDVSFNKYGDREFITLIWVGGRSSGMKINESKYEQSRAQPNNPVGRLACSKAVRYVPNRRQSAVSTLLSLPEILGGFTLELPT